MSTGWTREQMAARVAKDIPEGAYVNLGIGLPTLVANYLPTDKDIFLQSENGLLGMGPPPAKSEERLGTDQRRQAGGDAADRGLLTSTMPTVSAMMRGGHLDVCVLGAIQVAANGDLGELVHG